MKRDCGAGELVVLTDTSEMTEVILCGGSGYGDPAERAFSRIETDVRDGYVSREAASSSYGRRAAAE